MAEAKVVCSCGRIALRLVGKKGFCKEHVPEAFRASEIEARWVGRSESAEDFAARCLDRRIPLPVPRVRFDKPTTNI